MQRRTYIFFLFLFFCITRLFPQQLSFKAMNIPGLPADECYNVFQDKKGYVWIATENGLCKYNGSKLLIFDKHNGLPERGVYHISEDSRGIHLITASNRILRIMNDSIVEEPYSKKLAQMLSNQTDRCYLYSSNRAGTKVHIGSSDYTYEVDIPSNTVTRVSQEPDDPKITLVSAKGEDYMIRNKGFYASETPAIFRVIADAGKCRIPLTFSPELNSDWRIRYCHAGKYFFFYCNNLLVRVDPQLQYTVYRLPTYILSLYADKENGLWVGMYQHGLYYYPDITAMSEPQHLLEDHSVTGTIVDREGAVWCSTLDKGIFYCYNRYVTDYSNAPWFNRSPEVVKKVEGKLFVSTGTNSYHVFEDGRSYDLQLAVQKNSACTEVFHYRGHWYFSNKNYTLMTDEHFKHQQVMTWRNPVDKQITTLCLMQIDSCGGRLFGVSYKELMELKGLQAVTNGLYFKSGRCLLALNDSILLVGSSTGLYRANVQAMRHKQLPQISVPVTKIIKLHDGRILIATKGEGLYEFKDGLPRKVADSAAIPDVLTDIKEDKHGTIWVASATGLIRMQPRGERFNIRQFTVSNGLPLSGVRTVAIDDETVYAVTSDGLCSFPAGLNLLNRVPPLIFMRSLSVNDGPVAPGEILRFPYDHNSVRIDFDVLTYKNRSSARLLYKFAGQDKTFKAVDQDQLNFEHLAPDRYELIVYALNNDGVKSLLPLRIRFEIEKPFWKTTWFITTVGALLALLTILTVVLMIRRIKRREEQKTAINKMLAGSQLAALQAQMNPHFIFNAINSIQHYILDNQGDEAYSYLAKFSRLIRMVLDHSRSSTLTLAAEISMLKIYIELEQLRFKQSFDFILDIKDVDTEELSIPAMLLQPYVENAIWHGLMNLDDERRGVLKIGIRAEQETLHVIIEDNGVGREQSMRYKKADVHTPAGMQLTEQRLSITRQILGYETLSVTITDLHTADGKAAGTRVSLQLPLIT